MLNFELMSALRAHLIGESKKMNIENIRERSELRNSKFKIQNS